MNIIVIILAYCIGSLSAAILLSKACGLPDPRTKGSGNPGATNVLRISGKGLAAMVLLGDGLKGWLPVALGHALMLSPWVLGLVALAAFLGHLYPVFFHFHGGKGVATAMGAWLGLAWPIGVVIMLLWLLFAVVFRYSSLAALVCALSAPWLAYGQGGVALCVPVFMMSALLIVRHRHNIRRLLSKTEPKIGHF